MLLHEIVEFAARRTPDAPALVAGETTLCFADLHDRILRLAAGIARRSAPGDRVAIVADNDPAFVEAYYAVPAAGRILTFLNARLHPEELASTLADSTPTVLIGHRAHLAPLAGRRERFLSVRTTVCIDAPTADDLALDDLLAPHPEPLPDVSADDPAWLIYTSGTTGRPKGVILTHRSIVAAVLDTALSRPVADDDVYVFPFPLYHVAGYNVPLFHLHARPVVLLPRFTTEGFLTAVERHRATATSLAPTMISMLLDDPATSAADLSSLRCVGYGASAIPAEVLRRGLRDLGCDFAQGYGMTELSGNAAFLSADDHRRGAAGDERLLRAAGRPGPLVSIRVVDTDGCDVPVGDTGEIVVRGDQVTPGYWNDPDATAAAFRDGWFRTGDVGHFDADGYLYVVDRTKDIIVTGGENVSSREVEDVLYRHPGVREVAVIGLPDERWGERVCAVVVRRDGVDVAPAELIDLVAGHLAGYKKPREVVFADELPTTASGKIRKQALRDAIARDAL